MIGEAIRKLSEDINLVEYNSPEEYLQWDDLSLYYELLHNEKTKSIIQRINTRDLLKSCYEKPSIILKDNPKKFFTKKSSEIREEIAEKAKVAVEEVFIDLPFMPSVPYQHTSSLKPNEIPVISVNSRGKKTLVNLDNYSLFFPLIQGYFNIIRVYTSRKFKSKVGKAAKKVLEDSSVYTDLE